MVTEARDVAAERKQVVEALGLEDSLLGRRRGMTQQQRENVDKYIALKKRLAISGVRTAYVLNMNPYQLKVNGVLMDDMIVPACPEGEEYTIKAITEERVSWRDDKDGAETPIEFVPLVLVREFEREYYKAGGVVVFEATGNPNRPKAVALEIEENPDLVEKIKEAKSRMLTFAAAKYQDAETAYASGKTGYREITDLQRKLAGVLMRNRMIEKPKWMEPTRAEADIAEPCPRCKAEPKRGATVCSACSFVLDPEGAYALGDLDIENPVDKRALMRLSREKLIAMNISDFIDENLDERDERLAKAAEKPKGKKETANKD